MLRKNNKLEIFANNQIVYFADESDLNLRINNTIFNPEKIETTTGEFSYSFDLPICPQNNRIFGYSNNLAVMGKFNRVYNAEVYVDGILIVEAQLYINSINKETYSCNLINIKLNKIDEIFGELKLNSIKWEVPFTGTNTMNDINANTSTKYFFPMVCYGTFQKLPIVEGTQNYTSKYVFDKYNRFYWENFYPSMNYCELIKKCFEVKGMTVVGDIFEDEMAKQIYLSTNLANDQDPTFNLGSVGNLNLSFEYKNWSGDNRRTTYDGYVQDLIYPKEKANANSSEYNFSKINNSDIFAASSGYLTNLTSDNKLIFRDNCIIVPADGVYKITMSDISVDINDNPDTMNVYKWGYVDRNNPLALVQNTINKGFDAMPVEIQLLRGSASDNDTELINGQNTNDFSSYDMYPHEDKFRYISSGSGRNNDSEGYTVKYGMPVAYDPFANSYFLCGFSSLSGGVAYIKNGTSWNSSISDVNQSRYNIPYYYFCERKRGTVDGHLGINTTYTNSDHNQNTLGGVTTDYFSNSGTYKKNGKLQMMVYLKKNEVIKLKCITKAYFSTENQDTTTYKVRVSGKIKFESWSPNPNILTKPDLDWNTISDNDKFSDLLQLGNFLNKETKISDFVNNFIKTYNLSLSQNGNIITLNKQKINNTINSYIDLDDRVNPEDIESERIDYPTSLQVSFKIDEEEAGFVNSVPSNVADLPNWTEFADVGSEKIPLDPYSLEVSDSNVSLNMSYTWYADFKQDYYNMDGSVAGQFVFRMPIIEKDEYMIDYSKYEEAMQHDGRSLSQRMWFRGPQLFNSVDLWDGSRMYITLPKPILYDKYTLKYTEDDDTLLTRFFNIYAHTTSNYINVNVYLTAQEYLHLKNGGYVKIDTDLYIPVEINGYDPLNNNETELKLMKLVQ